MRKFFIALVVSVVFLFNVVSVNAAVSGLNKSQLESGAVGISYTSKVDKLKVLVEKDGKRYQYNLNNEGVEEFFPLQMGNGEYKVSVLENVGGDKYKYVFSEKVNLDLSDSNKVYLSSVQNVNWNSENEAVKKAQELTRNLKNDQDKLKVLYSYVVDNLKYDYDKLSKLESTYLPDIDATLESGKGICYDYSATLAAMLRSCGIPAKLVKGYSTNVNGYHAWNEVYNKETKSWIVIDSTYDSQMKSAKAKYNMEKKADQYTKVNEY